MSAAAMGLHLIAISETVVPGRHAAVLVDHAGWHSSAKLAVPSDATVARLPAKCTELNAEENIRRFMREDWPPDRAVSSYDDILDHCCDAWNRLTDQPWTIRPIGLRGQPHEF